LKRQRLRRLHAFLSCFPSFLDRSQIFVGLFFVPESPRWYLSKDRIDDATHALGRIHKGEEGYYPDREIQVQLDAKAAEAKESGGESRWVDLFKGAQRKKLFGAFGILCCQQINGVQFVFSYGTVFFDSIGIKDPFLITMVTDSERTPFLSIRSFLETSADRFFFSPPLSVVEVVGVLCSFFIVNRYPRRPLLVSTAFMMFILMLVAGCLGCVKNPSKVGLTPLSLSLLSVVLSF
jgi:SP family sugar:H+ symporter-like MFS transporter